MLSPQAEATEGGPFFDICAVSRSMYPQFAAELLEETGIDPELDRTGTLFAAFSENDFRSIVAKHEWQRSGELRIELLSAEETRRREPFMSPDVYGALYFPDDWQVENRKLVSALRRFAELNGIDVRENFPVDRLSVNGKRVTGVESGPHSIRADVTVLAAGAWTSLIGLGIAPMPFRIEPVRGQVIAFHTAKRLFRHVIYSRRGYLIPRSDGRILAGATSEHVGFENTLTASAASTLQEMSAEIAPGLAGQNIYDHWSGLRPMAPDGLPILGRVAGHDGLLAATGHYRNGILLAPWTAREMAAAIVDEADSPYFLIFGAERLRFMDAVA
jgi:glycine oxidase